MKKLPFTCFYVGFSQLLNSTSRLNSQRLEDFGESARLLTSGGTTLCSLVRKRQYKSGVGATTSLSNLEFKYIKKIVLIGEGLGMKKHARARKVYSFLQWFFSTLVYCNKFLYWYSFIRKLVDFRVARMSVFLRLQNFASQGYVTCHRS